MSKSGPLDTYLLLIITCSTEGKVYHSQTHYIDELVEEHLLSDVKAAHVPSNTYFSDMNEDTSSPQTNQQYAKWIGMLKWVANGTRPDILFAVNRQSQLLIHTTDIHWHQYLTRSAAHDNIKCFM